MPRKSRPRIGSAEGRIPAAALRSTWAVGQGLTSEHRQRRAVDVIRKSGWILSPGSAAPYLSFHARLDSFSREKIDAEIFGDGDILEVPSVRGCAMLVPRSEVLLALAFGRTVEETRFQRLQKVCAVTESEVRRLGEAILAILGSGRVPVAEIRSALPPPFVRSLGPEGKKLGDSTTLSVALRDLAARGCIRRIPVARRLDSTEYEYGPMDPSIHRGSNGKVDRSHAVSQLARLFFSWAVPATLREFCWWSGLSRREAKASLDRLDLMPLAGEGWSDEGLVFRGRNPAEDSASEEIHLLPFRDNFLYYRRGLAPFLSTQTVETEVLDWKNRPAPLSSQDSLHHHAILIGNALAGIWDYDPENREIVWSMISPMSAPILRRVEEEVRRVERVIVEELGDLTFYGMDSARNRVKRIEWIHRMRGKVGSP